MKNIAVAVILFCSVLALSSGMLKQKTVSGKLLDTVTVNVCKLRFKTSAGRPVDFKMGLNSASPIDILVSIGEPYIFKRIDVILVRGKRPVSLMSYADQKEVVIDKSIFTNAQPGDRLCIDLGQVEKDIDGVRTPVELDVPVFNIPLY